MEGSQDIKTCDEEACISQAKKQKSVAHRNLRHRCHVTSRAADAEQKTRVGPHLCSSLAFSLSKDFCCKSHEGAPSRPRPVLHERRCVSGRPPPSFMQAFRLSGFPNSDESYWSSCGFKAVCCISQFATRSANVDGLCGVKLLVSWRLLHVISQHLKGHPSRLTSRGCGALLGLLAQGRTDIR